MRGWLFLAVVACDLFVSACAATTPTSKVAVDYNRIFAKARNEVLITNILRASAREPLQFSTMGTVTGGVRNSGSLDVSISNLIGKAATILSPSLTVNEGINPAVSIVPLSDKEFTEGIMKPVTLDEINYFINQGWDHELVLELVVGGIVCPDGHVVFSRGDPDPDANYMGFAQMFATADRFPIQVVTKHEKKVVRMPASDAMGVLKSGVGPGRTVDAIDPVVENNHRTAQVDVTIGTEPTEQLIGLRTQSVCGLQSKRPTRNGFTPAQKLVEISSVDGKQQGKVILRSVEAIIYFLGETQRFWWDKESCVSTSNSDRPNLNSDWPYYVRNRTVDGKDEQEYRTIMHLYKWCSNRPVPPRAFVQTHFNDEVYYMLRQADAGDSDRSLSTLSLLNELIALQTSQSTVAAGTPIIAIGGK